VAWAAENGIVNGVGNNLFKPDGNMTRQELVTVLYRYVKWASENGSPELGALLNNIGSIPFDDSDEIADWARDAVMWAYANGIITGKPGNIFDSRGQATRAEIAAILHRFILAIEEDDAARRGVE
jgi:hypothetical protein